MSINPLADDDMRDSGSSPGVPASASIDERTLGNGSDNLALSGTTTSTSDVQRSVALAAEARAAEARSGSSQTVADEIDTMRFYRCLDQDLLPPLLAPAQRTKMLGVLATILVLLENATNKGLGAAGDTKFLQIKLANTAIRQRLDLANEISKHPAGPPALDWLQLSGWRQTVVNFQEHLLFPSQPSAQRMVELETGIRILKERLTLEKEKLQASQERQKAANAYEANRKALAMQQFKEDRQLRKEKDDRAKQARQAQSILPTSPKPPTSPEVELPKRD